MHIYIIHSLVHSNLTGRPGLRNFFGPWTAFWACPPGLLDLPGPQYCLPGPQYCVSWPSGCHLDTIWTPSGRQVDAK